MCHSLMFGVCVWASIICNRVFSLSLSHSIPRSRATHFPKAQTRVKRVAFVGRSSFMTSFEHMGVASRVSRTKRFPKAQTRAFSAHCFFLLPRPPPKNAFSTHSQGLGHCEANECSIVSWSPCLALPHPRKYRMVAEIMPRVVAVVAVVASCNLTHTRAHTHTPPPHTPPPPPPTPPPTAPTPPPPHPHPPEGILNIILNDKLT
jgi:hypothetical protein